MVALVQAPAPTLGTSTTTLAVTIAATGTGNALIVCSQAGDTGATNQTVTGITLGGSSAGWVVVKSTASSSYPSAEIWWCPTAASGQTAIVITYAGGSGNALSCVYVYEVSGLAGTIDKTAGNGSASGASPATVSSGATATTATANEFWVGIAASYDGTGAQSFTAIGAPPWVNGAQQAQVSGSMYNQTISGYQIATSTGTATYSATITDNSWAASVATFNGGAGYNATAVLASGTGASSATTSPYALTSNTKGATAASDLGGNYGSWGTPQYAEGGP